MGFGNLQEIEREIDMHKGKIVIEAYKMDKDKMIVALSLVNKENKKSEIIEVDKERKEEFVSFLEKHMEKVLESQRPLVRRVLVEMRETNI